MTKRLYRVERGRRVAGVCGGIAKYINVDPTVVRLLWILLILCAASGILAYLIAAIIMPSESEVFAE